MYFMFNIKRYFQVIVIILMTLTEFGDMRTDPNLEVITRDVCIIGGGSTGTFAAVQLRKIGKSVVVVEKENVLGGHTNTYTDPITKMTVDYGVIVFENLPVVTEYLNYLQVNITNTSNAGGLAGVTKYFDFGANKIVNNVTPQDIVGGLQAYAAELFKYPQLSEGFFLPDPIPEDLLLPFGQFVAKYTNISGAVNFIFEYAQGLGDLLRQPTLYVFKNIGINIIAKDFTEGFIATQNGDNSEIYTNAYKYKILQENVLLQSYPVQVERSAFNGVEVIVQTPRGCKLIKAKKLLVTIPPKLANLNGFDLDNNEKRLFRQFMNTGYYAGLVRNTGIPPNVTLQNIKPNEPYGIPTLPGLYNISPTIIEDVFVFNYGSPSGIPDVYVKADILASLYKLQENGIAKWTFGGPQFVEYRSHAPFELTVAASEIKKGFYKELYALQGQRSTYWTGGTFHSQNSGLLWQFTLDYVLPDLINSLN